MKTTVTVILALVALSGTGCGGAATPTPASPADASPEAPPATPPPATGDGLPDAFVEARAQGASEEEAYRIATRRLAEAVYGDAAWARYLPGTIHDRDHDPIRVDRTEGGVAVRVGLSRQRVEGMLAVLETPPATAPPSDVPLNRDLFELLRTARAELACARTEVLFDTPCAGGGDDLRTTADRVADLATRILLEPVYPDGVPIGDEGMPLRPPAVRARYALEGDERSPAPDLPLSAASTDDREDENDGGSPSESPDAPRGAQQAVTDAQGLARFPLSGDRRWRGPLRVTVDANALLGPLASHWPGEIGVLLRGREIGPERWVAVVRERVQGSPAAEPVVKPTLLRALQAQGLGPPLAGEDIEGALDATASVETLRGQLPTIVDQTRGRLDVVLVVEADSEFARRAGAQRVWYEARGGVTALSVWTGRELAAVDGAVTVQGLGEIRADRAARTQLALALAAELVAAYRE